MKRAGPRNAATTWIASVDVGGTFTDLVLQRGKRVVSAIKVPTTPRNPEAGVLRGLKKASNQSVDELVHATTLASNALLSRRAVAGGKVGLVTTRGFRDVLEIGRQNRPELYNLQFQRPPPLVAARNRYELEERSFAAGRAIPRVRAGEVKKLCARMKHDRVRSVAVSFLHSYANPANERRVARYLRNRFDYVSVSSEVAPEPREYERTSTTVVNAVLMPVVSRYMQHLDRDLGDGERTRVSVMSSSGGLIPVEEACRRPVQIIESGPAAGVIAAAELARRIGIRDAISFDMGGTTAKAGTIADGEVETTSELEVGGPSLHGRRAKGTGYPVRFPFVDLVEVSAGGGTIIEMDAGGALTVGPASAGSDPGPACYGRGGKNPTLTDANVAAGILGSQLLGGELPLDTRAARQSLESLGDPNEVAERALRLADLEMSRAIRLVTVERGLDPARFTLIAFGGAGPQHAANIARELGITRVVVPSRPGLFSALGLLESDWKFEERMAFPTDPGREFARLEQRVRRKYPGATLLRTAECRYTGQGSELAVRAAGTTREAIVREFERVHHATFGFRLGRSVEIVMIRVFGVLRRVKPSMRRDDLAASTVGRRLALIDGKSTRVTTCPRRGLAPRVPVHGPACVEDYDSTIFLPPGWHGHVSTLGEFWMEGDSR